MAKSRITFTDDVGAATLQSSYPEPACRFSNWTPTKRPVGDSAHDLADEGLHMFRTSWRYGATFQVEGLAMGSWPDTSPLNIADRLIAHLLNGGTCAVITEDAYESTYSTCGLMPGTVPSLAQSNRRSIEYTLTLALINLAASPVQMVCHYLVNAPIAYLMASGEANIYVLGFGHESAEATAFLKDDGTGTNTFDLDNSLAEKDRDFFLVDQGTDSNLVVV